MLKKTLLFLAKKNPIFASFKKKYQSVRDNYYKNLKIDDKLIVFEAFQSTKYADSPKAIYKYMINNDDFADYKFVWLINKPEKYKFLSDDGRTKVIAKDSHGYYKSFAQAKYWVVNGWLPLRVQKKPEQIVLQCWHGTPLKKLRHDIKGGVMTNHKKNIHKNDSDIERYDYFITTSKYNTEVTLSGFNLKGLGKEDIIIETGYPRNDALVNATKNEEEKYRSKYNLPNDKKVILYAPTWRDYDYVENEGYQYINPVDFDMLREKLSDKYVVLFRAHNFITNQFDFSKYKDFIYDVSDVDDINELFIASDVLITDYSSILFDYVLTDKPMIFYMYDLDYYQNDVRGFYIDVDTLPGDIVQDEKQVVEILDNLDEYTERSTKNYDDFRKIYNYNDDGRATDRVVRQIFNK